MKVKHLLITVFIFLSAISTLFAQEPITTESDIDTAEETQAVQPGQYFLGVGDIISVTINLASTDQTLSTKIEKIPILADGSIILPYVNEVQAIGLTCPLLAIKITQELKKEFRNPFVEVAIVESKNHTVTVLSEQLNGVFPIMSGDHLLKFLARNVTSERPYYRNTLIEYKRAQIIRRDGSLLEINLVKFILEGDTLHNPLLLNGDRIILSVKVSITVLGKVKKPGIHEITTPVRIHDVIAIAEGITERTTVTRIKIIRRNQDETIEFIVKTNLEKKDASIDIPLRDGDIVYVIGRAKIDWRMARDFIGTVNILLSTAMMIIFLRS
ncbi:MAG: polysaccharide biosynthesis/export family protein [Calditrichaeota bacterium]|nr:polysaccharide biosynthesis/export family protein [Calditrichota bacterium]